MKPFWDIAWPFISKQRHENIVLVLQSNIYCHQEVIDTQRELIAEKNSQIEQLTSLLTENRSKTVTITERRRPESTNPQQFGRSGWRGMSAAASDATVPAVSDSQAALDKRVKDSGGKV